MDAFPYASGHDALQQRRVRVLKGEAVGVCTPSLGVGKWRCSSKPNLLEAAEAGQGHSRADRGFWSCQPCCLGLRILECHLLAPALLELSLEAAALKDESSTPNTVGVSNNNAINYLY